MKDKEPFSWYKELLSSFEQSSFCFNENVFLDSNILIYSLLKESTNNEKHPKTLKLFKKLESQNKEIIISTQVLNEVYNVLVKKYKQDSSETILKLEEITKAIKVAPVDVKTVKTGWKLCENNNYSIYDSLILASAIENGCDVLYSEDMQDGHKVNSEGKNLKIINPYK